MIQKQIVHHALRPRNDSFANVYETYVVTLCRLCESMRNAAKRSSCEVTAGVCAGLCVLGDTCINNTHSGNPRNVLETLQNASETCVMPCVKHAQNVFGAARNTSHTSRTYKLSRTEFGLVPWAPWVGWLCGMVLYLTNQI